MRSGARQPYGWSHLPHSSHTHLSSLRRVAIVGLPVRPAPGTRGRCVVAGEFTDVHFLTVAEVAALMRVSRMTVYRLVHAGQLPAIRVGKSFRVPERAVHDYLRQSFVDTA